MKPASVVNRLALRGAVAASIAILITTVLSLERPYWLIMVAVVLVNQTTGQSLQRAGQRVAATVAGVAVGWLLEWITVSHHWAQVAVMLAAIFLAVFFRQSWGRGSYIWMMFFISLYVVFLFALLGEWSPAIFLARIYNTFLGAGAAVLSAYLVPSPDARARLRREAEDLWNNCRKQLSSAVAEFAPGRSEAFGDTHPALLSQLDQIRSHASEALYENFLSPAARRGAREDLARAEMLCHFALALLDALACAPENADRGPVHQALVGLLDPVLRASFSDYELPPGGFEPGRPRPTSAEVCELVVNIARSARVPAHDHFWSVPALYYAAALSHALKAEARSGGRPDPVPSNRAS